jgi:hypothetical protein
MTFLGPLDDLVVVDSEPDKAEAVAYSIGAPARHGDAAEPLASAEPGDVVILATPVGHARLAQAAIDRGLHVVSVADAIDEVEALLRLDPKDVTLAVGASFSPGLSCVLAALASRAFERVAEIHVAKVGLGGPACARHQRQALSAEASDWRDGQWERHRGGSGRELCWFPDPIRGRDCYRAALPEPALLHAAFPDARRITARIAANRRERLAAFLPEMRKPHPEGTIGAIRVEVRGTQGVSLDDRVFGAVDRPAVASGAVAAMTARFALDGRLIRTGHASGLASLVEPGPFLAALADRGVKVAAFEGNLAAQIPA